MLLFDENLSPRLCSALANELPGSVHVHEIGLGNADDVAVWQDAKDRDLIIVTKDSDFPDLQGVKGFPPKVLWLRVGNCSTGLIEALLRDHQSAIQALAQNPDVGLLIIR